jgi:hypothetical protein
MIDEYPLSPEQSEAVMVMFHDLDYAIWGIVAAFQEEGYPVTKRQVAEIIQRQPAYDPLQSMKSIYSQMVDMIMGAPDREFSPAY